MRSIVAAAAAAAAADTRLSIAWLLLTAQPMRSPHKQLSMDVVTGYFASIKLQSANRMLLVLRNNTLLDSVIIVHTCFFVGLCSEYLQIYMLNTT